MLKKIHQKSKGFALIELLAAVGVISALLATVTATLNPLERFTQVRNEQRWSDIEAISNAINQRLIDNQGSWLCYSACSSPPCPFPPVNTPMMMGDDIGEYNICPCLVPDYLTSIPIDPITGIPATNSPCTNYTTGYKIGQNPLTGAITISSAANEKISVTR